MTDSPPWVAALSDPANTDALTAGGKAASLCKLMQEGLPVPPGFVISIAAFQTHFPDCSPTEPPAVPVIDSQLMEAAYQAFDALVGSAEEGGDKIVVRSSAVGEDGAEQSFAGQHATYYYVAKDDLEQAVTRCWMSLWSPAARAYRQERPDAASVPFGMAVILQRMVQAESSGVCFTQDPTGQFADHALVEATWGLGAALVDGRVSPDRFFMAKDGTITSQRVGRKRFKVAENLANGSEHRLDHVPAQLQTRPAIDSEQLNAVVNLARRAQDHYQGTPQDIEWAFQDGTLYLLQSRPVSTSLATPSLDTPDGRWVLFKPVIENFHEPLTPMSVDLFERLLPPIGRFITGRYYLDFDRMKLLMPFQLSDGQLAEMLLLRGIPSEIKVAWGRVPLALGALITAYLCTGVTWHRTARLKTTALWRFATLAERVKQDPDMDALRALYTLALGKHPLEPIGARIFQANVSASRYFFLLDLLKRFLKKFAPGADPNLTEQVCTGNDDMFSRQMVDSMHELAETARSDPHLCALLEAEHDPSTARHLSELPDDHPFCTALDEFLATFGHRCAKEIDLATPRWREDPLAVLAMVRTGLAEPSTGATERHGLRLAALDELHQALGSRWKRWIADRLIDRVRYYVTLRENTRHFHSMAFDVLRAKLKQQEQMLLGMGKLKCQDDIFFLSWPEARALQEDSLQWSDLEEAVRARRRTYNEQSRTAPPSTLNMTLPPQAEPSSSNHLLGSCASPGLAEGTIRVLLDPAQGAELQPGDILVAPYTDPAWTPLFPTAAAVVVEVGSYLSHAGTVAREYRIPCLVDVANCTRDLRSGQRVRVNATDGHLEVLE